MWQSTDMKKRRRFLPEPKRSVSDALADLEKGWPLAQAEHSQIAVELIQMSNFPRRPVPWRARLNLKWN